MRSSSSNALGYAKGLDTAIAAGRAAAESGGENPYRRYEHREGWRLGFTTRRNELAAPRFEQLRLPYKD